MPTPDGVLLVVHASLQRDAYWIVSCVVTATAMRRRATRAGKSTLSQCRISDMIVASSRPLRSRCRTGTRRMPRQRQKPKSLSTVASEKGPLAPPEDTSFTVPACSPLRQRLRVIGGGRREASSAFQLVEESNIFATWADFITSWRRNRGRWDVEDGFHADHEVLPKAGIRPVERPYQKLPSHHCSAGSKTRDIRWHRGPCLFFQRFKTCEDHATMCCSISKKRHAAQSRSLLSKANVGSSGNFTCNAELISDCLLSPVG